ncbi:GNAT family N-acetyltransferase [Paenibacillus sp. J14]|uniref:GNAT family N-acetyltransferase n=1 Tax=Paenibacillus sp. (strain J14) TaxID=935845 RepID=UPI00048FF497|nr:GNAT family N-acetyltransferase [Paenibacillus sp. J14]
MGSLILSNTLVKDIENSEIEYMQDRMIAIRSRGGNPEGIEIKRFGNALCLYSKTMPWRAFNTVKGVTNEVSEYLTPIVDFFRERDRKIQFEIVPSLVNENTLKRISDRGFYQSGFHTSTYIEPQIFNDQLPEHITIQELSEDQFETYALIHCRGTGLPDNGIAPVAANNKVLYNRPGWKFFVAFINGEPAAAAVMYSNNGIASLTFAATLPEYRGNGLHQFLLKRRITEAKKNNCRLVVGQCNFLSQSHRNMERIGMKIGYIRTTWTER